MRRWAVAAAVVFSISIFAFVRFRPDPPTDSVREQWTGSAKRFRDRATDPRHEDRGTLSGRVIDENGGAIASAQVCASGSSAELSSEETRKPRCTSSNASGEWRIGDLFAASWNVDAAANGWRPARWRDARNGDADIRLAPGASVDGLDIVLVAGGLEVRGRVKDASGGAVAGARVSISSGSRWSPLGANVVESDQRGEFTGWAAEGPVSVTADADGYAPGTASGSAPGAAIEVLLSPESVLAGMVVDARTKKPIAGARVGASENEGWRWKRAITGADGRFRIVGLEPGRYKPGAESPGRSGRALESVLLGLGETRDGIVIEMHEARIVAGRVVLESGAPCPEGGVRLASRESGSDEWATVERNGTVLFKAVLESRYEVTVRCTGFLAEDKYDPVVVGSENVDGLVWKVRDGASIRGIVVDDAGEPVASATLEVEPEGGDPRSRRRDLSATSAHDGTFVIAGVGPGEWSIGVSAPGFSDVAEPVRVRVDDRDVEDLHVRLDRGGSIAGEVVDSSGAPIAGAAVRAIAEQGRPGSVMRDWREAVTTLDDGTFAILGVRPGAYRVVATRPGTPGIRIWRTAQTEPPVKTAVVSGQQARVRIVLAPATDEIRGTVVDANGAPVADAFVDAEPRGDDTDQARAGLRTQWSRQPTIASKDGSFTISSLAAGTYLVRAFRRGGGEAIADNVKTGTSVTLTLRTTGSLAGTVEIEGGGEPPITFYISVTGEDGFRRREEFFQSRGRWILHDVPPGKYDVAVNAPEGTAMVPGVELSEAGVREGIRLTLVPRARVRGRIVDFDTSDPVPGLTVFIAEQTQSSWRFSSAGSGLHDTNISDPSGEFIVEHAPTGDVSLAVVPVNRGEYGFVRMPLSLAPGEDRDVGEIRVRRAADEDGRARNGWLGFAPELGPADAAPIERKWSVKRVMPSSPALAAGLLEGDVILKVNGQDVTGSNSYLFGGLTRVSPGQVVTLELERGDSIPITAAARP